MASEKTLCSAIGLFNSSDFRREREEQFPGTCPQWDARAAAFAAMDSEGRFEDSQGEPMSREESAEFEMISTAVLKMSN